MKSGQNHAGTPSGDKISAAAPLKAARQKGKNPLMKIEIPALYNRPVGDRDLQGCMKARA